ncbi:MAG: SH3 domain-containing protein [Oscillospiraceae bacterium]|nr:SH3 domain-containing protein [Oscillospiraceae bacterium]
MKFSQMIAKFLNICSKIKLVMFVILLAVCLFCLAMAEIQASAAPEQMESALQWAVMTANDDSHGYSQVNRWGNPDYDCSSFIISALRYAGIPTGDASSTKNLRANLTAGDFTWIPRGSHALSNTEWLERGDILLSNGHAEIFLGNYKTVAAHQNYGYSQGGDQNGKEISVGNYWYDSNYGCWQGVLRCNAVIADACTEEYTGNYEVMGDLNLRTGHGTWSGILDVIPAGTVVSVSKSDGIWGHVQYYGREGLCSMSLLARTDAPVSEYIITGDVNADSVFDTKDLLAVQDWLLGIGSLADWRQADQDYDGMITIFDLAVMKQLLLAEQET